MRTALVLALLASAIALSLGGCGDAGGTVTSTVPGEPPIGSQSGAASNPTTAPAK
jgi:hypothetical protein